MLLQARRVVAASLSGGQLGMPVATADMAAGGLTSLAASANVTVAAALTSRMSQIFCDASLAAAGTAPLKRMVEYGG